MTKKDFEHHFKTYIMPAVAARYEQDGIPDKPARREAWNNTVDAYIKDGMLPERAGDWKKPDWLEKLVISPSCGCMSNPLGMSWGKWAVTALFAAVGITGFVLGHRVSRRSITAVPADYA